jgi:hypothetical protein
MYDRSCSRETNQHRGTIVQSGLGLPTGAVTDGRTDGWMDGRPKMMIDKLANTVE